MAAGVLLPDELVLQLLGERLGGGTDASRNGWLLDGFPRTTSQERERASPSCWPTSSLLRSWASLPRPCRVAPAALR